MKRRTILSAAGAVATAATFVLCVAPWSTAVAQTQMQSNQNLQALSSRIAQDITALSGDDTDYGGHRLKAIQSMQVARKQIAAAADYVTRSGAVVNPAPAAPAAGVDRNQANSDANINAVRNNLQQILSGFNADANDYGGHKSKAASAINNAVSELGMALQYRQQHPNVH